jgi:3-deoxy-7-phosphoheptulonate synthase
MESAWTPTSWQQHAAAQQPQYPDPAALQSALTRLAQLPPLVTSWEIEGLKSQLAAAARGECFVLQGGDCCELFAECSSEIIVSKLKILLQMALILIQGSGKQVVRLGRFGGQYAKPRSADTETQDGTSLPTYRGDLINGSAFDPVARQPDPERLVRGYGKAALTLNFIRALGTGGFADLHHPQQWNLDFASDTPQEGQYQGTVRRILESIEFVETVTGSSLAELGKTEFYTCHEGLLLWYEQAQTRQVPRRSGWYNLSTHFPWIGDRTRDPGGAHVEYFRGIANPIGVKLGPSVEADALVELIRILDPSNDPGRLTLICRFGLDRIDDCLPPMVEAVRASGHTVLWCCDPMHGNTELTDTGIKTRRFEKVLGELDRAMSIHRRLGSWLGGVHVELTGEDVTECIGGARGLNAQDLSLAYRSLVDPRLNYEQSLELALLIARRMES